MTKLYGNQKICCQECWADLMLRGEEAEKTEQR